jgi:ketosteroid isomerase-like protein
VSELLRILDEGYTLLWREGRPEEALSPLKEDFEWVVPDMPEERVRHGADGVLEFVREWTEPFEDMHVEWELLEAGPDRVLALIHISARGRESGVPTEMRFGQLWTFRDRRPVRMVMINDLDQAHRAAGLDP